MDMRVSRREKEILAYLDKHQKASVFELSNALSVSEVTIRRDLIRMSDEKKIDRFHGGAKVNMSRQVDSTIKEFNEKSLKMQDEKLRIGIRACDFIHDGDIVFMNSGTTVLKMLENLNRRNVTIVTNNSEAFNCNFSSEIEILMLGGVFNRRTKSVGGEITTNSLTGVYSNCTILGVNALDIEEGMTTSVYQETSINNAMIAHTRGKVIVLADHTKLGKISSYVSSPLSKINVVITDSGCPSDFAESLMNKGIEVIIT